MTKYLWIFAFVLLSSCANEKCRDCGASEHFAPQPDGEMPCCEDAEY